MMNMHVYVPTITHYAMRIGMQDTRQSRAAREEERESSSPHATVSTSGKMTSHGLSGSSCAINGTRLAHVNCFRLLAS